MKIGTWLPTLISSCIHGAAAIQYAGVNLIGLAADASLLGTVYTSFESTSCGGEQTSYPYLDPLELYWEWRDLGFNMIRLPVAWGHIQDGLNGPLNQTTLSGLDNLVNIITSNGSTVILDIHNYARYYCAVIGQPLLDLPGAPQEVTDDNFTDLWGKLATHYKDNSNMIFELMNEPWGLSAFKWADTMKGAIQTLLKEAPSHRILVAGPYSATVTTWELRSALALLPLLDTAPRGQIIFDLHQYFDILNGGSADCLTWGLFYLSFETVTSTLRSHNATAMLTEFGGGPNDACAEIIEKLLEFFEDNSDVWKGWTAWSNMQGDQAISPNASSQYYKLAGVMEKFAPLHVE